MNLSQDRSNSGYIEEYQELRSEIRMYLDRRTKNIQLLFLFVVAVIGLYEKVGSPYFYLAGALIVGFTWFDHIRQLRAVMRTATYLEVFVEPEVTGLNWETRAAYHPVTMRQRGEKSSFLERSIANGAFPLFYTALALIALLDKTDGWPCAARLSAGCILTVFLFMLGYMSYDRLDRKEQVKAWMKIKNSLESKS